MIVVWSHGKGYVSLLVILGVLAAFGILLPVARGALAGGPTYWGFALLAAALANWVVGSRINRRKRAVVRPKGLRGRLLYRTGHRFMSLPMETFSIPVALLGLAVILTGFGA